MVRSNPKLSNGSKPTARKATARLFILLFTTLTACGPSDPPRGPARPETEGDHARAEAESCPATLPAPRPLAGIPAPARTLGYWLGSTPALDEPLVDAAWKHAHNAAVHGEGGLGALSAGSLYGPIDEATTLQRLNSRLAAISRALANGEYVAADGSKFSVPPFDPLAQIPGRTDELRTALDPLMLRCGPRPEGFYRAPVDTAFDRNNCSAIREGDELRVLGRFPNGMQLVRTRHALGFIDGAARLSEPRDHATARADRLARNEATPALTRRAFLTAAFEHLDEPYGWGGHGGARDCSSFVLDVLDRFGVEMPRHSASQALAGHYSIDVGGVANLDEKLAVLDEAHAHGIVLLEFAGHIMIYLGRFEDGRPMVLHAFSEYVERCEGGDETVRRADRVDVSDLSLGLGSSRGSFLERLRRITVLAEDAPEGLRALAEYRQASPAHAPSECRDSLDVAIFAFPRVAHAGAPLRVVATTRRELGPAALTVFDESGAPIPAEVTKLGGPVHGYALTLDAPPAGRLEARLGDGPRVDACQRILVRRHPEPRESAARAPGSPAWTPRWKWEEDTENLFATFVEHLFAGAEGGHTWKDLDVVLDDPARNLLHGALGADEEARLRLSPDCADLPYFLRAYFAWKLSLPFGFRACSRGRDDRAPRCSGELVTSLEPTPGSDDVAAFQAFLRKTANTVHSSSMRTRPDDDRSDAYPLALTAESLPPGTVFADPYGHILVVARHEPPRSGKPGALVAVDAQPDGNMGVRTFWRGSFLFDPSTKVAGAGFKGFRPLVHDPVEGRTSAVPLDEIRGPLAFSMEQYQGTTDDFYRKVERAVSPRPLDAAQELRRLVEALDENVQRRVLSVQNGEDYLKGRKAAMTMPEGASIFQTSGAWEDFATPSRDLRLLISIDEVLGFPARAAAHPERFVGEVDEASLEALLEAELRARSFTYANSAGAPLAVDLFTLTQRAERLEVAYNPNDCVEVRWGADPSSDEGAACARRAPDEQRARMERLRGWFRDRSRPAR